MRGEIRECTVPIPRLVEAQFVRLRHGRLRRRRPRHRRRDILERIFPPRIVALRGFAPRDGPLSKRPRGGRPGKVPADQHVSAVRGHLQTAQLQRLGHLLESRLTHRGWRGAPRVADDLRRHKRHDVVNHPVSQRGAARPPPHSQKICRNPRSAQYAETASGVSSSNSMISTPDPRSCA